MTEPVVCRDGKCRYKNKRRRFELEDVPGDDLAEQIEYALLHENIAM